MARKVLLETDYTFTPSTRNIVFHKAILRERLILITNVTTNQVIYNFSDPNLRATSYTINAANFQQGATVAAQTGVVTGARDTTTIVLNYNTASMSAADKLQILYDDFVEKFEPSETYSDPVSKLRVSTPQSLIDTDFEYSTQPSKWESLSLVQNYPSFYPKGTGAVAFDVSTLSGGNQSPRSTITATTSANHGLLAGDVVSVIDSTNAVANGTFLIESVPSGTQFTYLAKGQVNGSILDTGYTTVSAGGIYPGGRIPLAVSSTAMTYSSSTITVTTANEHGLFPGTPILVSGITATSNPPNGAWVITRVATPTTFEFVAAAAPTGTLASGTNFQSGILYTRPEGFQQHRATDGGVLITSGNNVTGIQQIRQTRRYFRYQSGKGIQFSTGAKFTPTYDISTISASGSTVTVSTVQDHNMQPGVTILVEGVESGLGPTDSVLYNGTRTVATVVNSKSFTYTTTGTPGDLNPGGTNVLVTAVNWVGAAVRTGLYDEQNGFFFEYDGQQLYACRRDSIKELFGTVNATQNSGTINGNNTRFLEQLIIGDNIVIKGQTYRVAQVTSDTSIRINPPYIGPTRSNLRYLKTQNYKVPQSQWNMDRVNGNGSSGYNLDISKMQMAYIDYTWYGAGFIRFGFRAVNGDIVYCHKMPNNNVNTSAYMRSGNLPGRFEAFNQGPYSRLVAGSTATRGSALGSSDTTMYVDNTINWPTSGFVFIIDGTNCELIQYGGIGSYNSTVRGYPLTGLTRRTSYSIAGINPTGSYSSTAYTLSGTTSSVTFTPDTSVGGAGTAQVSVQFLRCTCAPAVSHWGVSAIMDGGQDNDKSIIFTAGMNRYLSIGAGAARPLIALRIAPSVDSGIGKNYGIREILNRMQLTLVSLGLYSQGQFLIEGILNPQTITGGSITFPTDWEAIPVGSGSLAQVVYFNGTSAYNSTAATADGGFTGGDRIFASYADNAGRDNFSNTVIDLANVRDLGTSILSGPGQAGSVNPGYPVGPDILLITARNLEASGNRLIACRLSWTEAQA